MLKGICILYLISLGCLAYAQQPKFLIDGQAQGTSYRIQYYAPNSIVSKIEIDSVLNVIDQSMSLYDNQSLISAFNKEDKSVELDDHMANVVRRSFDLNRMSNGAFDITVMPLVGIWGFGPNRILTLPQPQTIDSILQFVGMDKLVLDGNTLIKKDRRVQVDLNGIAQGYSVDVISQFLDSRGIESYLVELGGEIKVKGYKDVNVPFEIAIESPQNAKYSNVVLQLTDKAVTTSGNYRRAFDLEGRRIHHHINPHDGYPIQNNVASVTVIAPTAMDADGYDNVFMAMTPEDGVNLANKLEDIEIYIIYKDNAGFKEAFSAGFHRYVKNN
ncbi:FAD:protein FMN transferase [Sphingobacterium phlebotomi]|uniref:FAD:protein FMN transferase n=1 Tax=Sphingobacterium phlebotomi TaxID=2605433 RepID=A0A5D4GR99_9SPHI|nr:FAD:protein FMN transferase [Sphingobacterium phlebotomi]TYR31286.1 FAD:protein FMN transferase [Sphingobacterium phlebotomi]